MAWKARVKMFERLRQEHIFGGGTIAGVAAKFGVHERTVRQAIARPLPPAHPYPPRAQPKVGLAAALIDRVLGEDQRAQLKQRHIVRRIYPKILNAWLFWDFPTRR